MKQVTEKLWIAPQPTAADFEEMKEKGIARIINNRPDSEEPGQPKATQSAAAASHLGMDYVHIPIVPGQVIVDKIRAFQKALAEADGPVLAHCKTGTRSLTLWAIGEVLDGRMTAAEIDGLGNRMGVDLAGARNWLKANT